MSLKARLRGAIVALVTAVVVVMSLLYLADFTKATFRAASDRSDLIADQFHIYLDDMFPSTVGQPLLGGTNTSPRKLSF